MIKKKQLQKIMSYFTFISSLSYVLHFLLVSILSLICGEKLRYAKKTANHKFAFLEK